MSDKSCCEKPTESQSMNGQLKVVIGICVASFITWVGVNQVTNKIETKELSTLLGTQNTLLEKLERSINSMVTNQQESSTQRALMELRIGEQEKRSEQFEARLDKLEQALYMEQKL